MRWRPLPYVTGLLLLAALASIVPRSYRAVASSDSPNAGLVASITTERGSLENGQNPVYQVGETLVVVFRVDGPVDTAYVAIAGVLPDGTRVPLFGADVPTNQTIVRPLAVIGGALGRRKLEMAAESGDYTSNVAACTFTVVAAPTRLTAAITTERGSLENGQNPVYQIGETLVVTFRIDGADQVNALIEAIFPDGSRAPLFQGAVQGNQTFTRPLGKIGGALGRRSVRLTASTPGGAVSTQAQCSFTVAAAPIAGIAIDPASLSFTQPAESAGAAQSVIITSTGTAPLTINSISLSGPDARVFAITADSGGGSLQPGQRRTVSIGTTPSAAGRYSASLLIASNAPGSPHTVLITATVTSLAPPRGPVQRGSAVGDPVVANGRLAIFGADPPGPNSAVTAITGLGEDGSFTVMDYAGTALLRVPAQGGPAQILLDTTRLNVQGGVGLARLQQVKSSRSGVHAVQVLRADNTRAIFRLDRDTLTLLAVLPEARGLAELAISDAGQIAYVAPLDSNPGSLLALFLALPGQQPRPLFSVGGVTSGGLTVTGIHSLQSNAAGVLTYILDLRSATGAPGQAVMRGTSAGQVGVVVTGQPIPGFSGVLTEVRQPRVGPDGTVVFLGIGSGFVNFFVEGPGRPLQPLLRPDNWSTAEGSFDYDIAAGGAIAIRAALGPTSDSGLYLVSPTGGVDTIVSGRRDLQPTAQPAFGPDDRLFFLAQNLAFPVGRNGEPETGLYRSRRVGGQLLLEEVAVPGQGVPEWVNVRLLGITQRPAVSGADLIFGVLFGGLESLPVPTAALFRVPVDGTLAAGKLVMPEGNAETDASRLAMLRDLSYRGDRTLIFYGLMPGAGPLIAPSSPPVTIASRFRTQAVQAGVPINPLVATGDNLGTGQLENTLPPLLSLGLDRELFVARTSLSQFPPRQADTEGLFTVNSTRRVEPAAVTRRSSVSLPNTTFNGFADIKAITQPIGPPSIDADGRVVFKALLNVNNQPQTGIFQWVPGAEPVMIRASENPEALMGWVAGKSGINYILERGSGNTAQLLAGLGASLQPVVSLGVTPEMLAVRLDGGALLAPNSSGDLFVVGAGPIGAGVYRLTGTGLVPLAIQGSPVPQDEAGRGFNFVSGFEFAPDSARGNLIFRATVQKPGGPLLRGEFELGPGGLFTRGIGSVDLTGARTLSVDPLGTTMPVQSKNGISVSARFDVATNGWSLRRFQLINGKVSEVIIAQDKKGDKNSRFAALDAGALLQQETDLRLRSGPVFTINDVGDVAFLASDGQSWGVYQVLAP